MKNFYFIAILLSLVATVNVFAQKNDASNAIFTAFKQANANMLSSHLNDNVELTMPQIDNVISKQQAKSILTDFFRKNPSKDFKVIHQGTKENASFIIATYHATTGNFRVSISLRKTENQSYIYQLRIEKSE